MEKEHYKILTEKYIAGDITEAEIKELVQWIRSNASLSGWWEQEFGKWDAAIDLALRNKMFTRIKAEVLKNTPNESSPKRTLKKPWAATWSKWAAIISIPICLAFFTYYIISTSGINTQSPLIVKADNGDKATIALPDGTHVILNSASQLSYQSDFGKKERRVRLDGEGYFKVAHDTRHAFIVQINEVEVKVMGTVFNISAYNDAKDVTVVLLEGKVAVSTPSSSSVMQPGEKIKYNKTTHQLTTEKVYPEDYTTWTKGNLYFQNESLTNIMKTLSRAYDINIRIDSPKIANERFTGTIPGGGIQNALNILMLTSSFRYEMKNSIIILKEK